MIGSGGGGGSWSERAVPKTEAIYRQIGNRIKEALAEAHMTQDQLAETLSMAPSGVSQWISGERRIGIEPLRRIAEILDRPVYWFLGEEPPSEDSVFAYELHRLSPEDRERALAMIRTLRETSARFRTG